MRMEAGHGIGRTLRSLLPWILVGALIAVDVVIFRTVSLNAVSDVLIVAVPVGVGFLAARNAIRRRPRTKVVRLLARAALLGMLASICQSSLRWGVAELIASPWWGLMLGGFGGVIYLALERAPKRRQDADEERRFRKILVDHDMSDPKNET